MNTASSAFARICIGFQKGLFVTLGEKMRQAEQRDGFDVLL
jgi:hypothetical protein